MNKNRFFVTLFILTIVVACGMRFAGLTYALPLDVAGDEFVHVATAFSFLDGRTLVASQALSYTPSLLAVLLAPLFGAFGVLGIIFGEFAHLDAFKEFAILNSTWFIVGARALSALFGIAFLWFLFLFTQRIVGREVALVAVILAAFDFWLVHESQMGHLWMPVTALLAVAWYMLLLVYETGERRWYLWFAIVVALGYWAGYIPVMLLLWLPLAHWLRAERKFSNIMYGGGLAVALLALVSFLNPVSFVRQFGRALNSAFEIFGISVFSDLTPVGEITFSFADKFSGLVEVLFWNNPFLFFLGLGGLVFFAFQKHPLFQKLLVIGFPALYALVFLTVWPHPDNRYVLPFLPAFLIGFAYVIIALYKLYKVEHPHIVRISASVFLLCALSWSMFSSIAYTKLLFENDTRFIAREWVLENIPAGASIVSSAKYFELPKNQAVTERLAAEYPEALRTRDRYLLEHPERFPAPAYFVLKPEEASALSQEARFSYIVHSHYAGDDMPPLPQGYELIASFYTQESALSPPDLLQRPVNPLYSLFGLGNLGPNVEVYKTTK